MNYLFRFAISFFILAQLTACGGSSSSEHETDINNGGQGGNQQITNANPEVVGVQCDLEDADDLNSQKVNWVVLKSKILFDQNLGTGFSINLPVETLSRGDNDVTFCGDVALAPVLGAIWMVTGDLKQLNAGVATDAPCANYSIDNKKAFSVQTRNFTNEGSLIFDYDYTEGRSTTRRVRAIYVLNKSDAVDAASVCTQAAGALPQI